MQLQSPAKAVNRKEINVRKYNMNNYRPPNAVYEEYGSLTEEKEYPFHMSDYDYLTDLKGEYDELSVDKETFAEHLYDTDDYYK